jgi:V8-like Glu-specific endopeptidase
MKLSIALVICFVSFLPRSNAGILRSISKIPVRVIYGIDDRRDLYEVNNSLIKKLSESVAVKIDNENLIQNTTGFDLVDHKLEQSYGSMCKSEKYLDQNNAGDCSGFLLDQETIVTAGHCIEKDSECLDHKWVFGFAMDSAEKKHFSFKNEDVYQCEKILARTYTDEGLDFAVIKLNRAVEGRGALKVRQDGKINDDSKIVVLGFPFGLPMKVTSNAKIRNNSLEDFFVINSDTFRGNSGSPVIDISTGIVEGIIVRGDSDFKSSETEPCYGANVNSEDDGRGEDIIRITNILKELK